LAAFLPPSAGINLAGKVRHYSAAGRGIGATRIGGRKNADRLTVVVGPPRS
jgi:hypothetical protein